MGRPREYPDAEDVFEAMEREEPYVVADLATVFGDDVSKRTVRRRLEELVGSKEVQQKQHASGIVTYWRV